jgi:hypothetical protein
MADYFSQRFDNLVLEPFEWDREGQRRPELDDFSPSCKDVLGMLYRADAAVPGGRGGKGPLLFRAVICALADRTPEAYESFAEMGRSWQDKCDEAEGATKDLKQVNELFTLMDSPALDQEQKAKLQKCFDPHCSARLCLDSCQRHYGPRARSQHVAVAAMVLMAQQSMAYAEESLSAEVAERRGRNATFLSSVKELEEGPRRERDAPINGSARVMCAFTRYLESYRSKTGTKEAKRKAAAAQEPQHLGGGSPKRRRRERGGRGRSHLGERHAERARYRSRSRSHGHRRREKGCEKDRKPVVNRTKEEESSASSRASTVRASTRWWTAIRGPLSAPTSWRCAPSSRRSRAAWRDSLTLAAGCRMCAPAGRRWWRWPQTWRPRCLSPTARESTSTSLM